MFGLSVNSSLDSPPATLNELPLRCRSILRTSVCPPFAAESEYRPAVAPAGIVESQPLAQKLSCENRPPPATATSAVCFVPAECYEIDPTGAKVA
jgi:hypothetical protein